MTKPCVIFSFLFTTLEADIKKERKIAAGIQVARRGGFSFIVNSWTPTKPGIDSFQLPKVRYHRCITIRPILVSDLMPAPLPVHERGGQRSIHLHGSRNKVGAYR